MKVAHILALASSMPALAALLALPAQAQRGEVVMPGGVVPAGTMAPPSPDEVLATNLRILAANPRDVSALTRAGQSALAVGDPNAALGFFARAEQIAPTDGRVKAGLGSTMVMMERPADAMALFEQAAALGAPERDYLRDRALGHDLLGNNRAAQRDYAAALRYGPDGETIRRYALSLGITGDRDQAIRLLDPLLRQQDQGAWRARAFVLALNGDQRGAERIVQQVMPGGMAAQMTAFLKRLPALNSAQRALAVNFGTMPGTGPTYMAADLNETVRAIPGSMTDTLTREEVAKPSFVADEAPSRRKNERAKRRRPGRDDDGRAVQVAAAAPAAPAARQPAPGFATSGSAPAPTIAQRVQPLKLPTTAPAPATVVRDAEARPAPPQPVRVAAEPEPSAIFEISAAPPPAARPVVVATPPAPAPVRQNVPVATPSTIPPVQPPALPSAAPSPVRVAVSLPPAAPPMVPAPAPAPASAASVALPPATLPAVQTPAPVASVALPPVPVSPPPAPPAVASVALPPAPVTSPSTTSPGPATPPLAVTAPVDVGQRPATPALIGPPAPEPAPAPVERPSPEPVMLPPPAGDATPAPARATISEPIRMASSAETSTQLEDPQANAGLSSLLDDLQPEESAEAGLPAGDEAFRRARLAAKRKADAELKAKEVAEAKAKADEEAKARKAEEDAKRAEARKHPPRVWVQVATGSAKSGIGITVKRVREQAGDTLKGAGAASVPFKATNRILMGPYKSEAEARQVVNGLAKKGLQANIFTSEAGQQISTLSGR